MQEHRWWFAHYSPDIRPVHRLWLASVFTLHWFICYIFSLYFENEEAVCHFLISFYSDRGAELILHKHLCPLWISIFMALCINNKTHSYASLQADLTQGQCLIISSITSLIIRNLILVKVLMVVEGKVVASCCHQWWCYAVDLWMNS